MSGAMVDGPRLRYPAGREWTWADLEIVEGGLHVSPTPSQEHQYAASHLWLHLNAAAPPEAVVLQDLDVDLGRNVFEPDVLVIAADSYGRKPLAAADVLLAVEVTSPSSRSMDRIIKPAAFAAAGVSNYWRVDIEGDPFVEIYELDAGAYKLVATARAGTLLPIERPFPVELDAGLLAR